MRHRKKGNKLGRKSSHRKAMLSNMCSALILNEYQVTTLAKAKACKSLTDKVVSLAKKKDLHSERKLKSMLKDELAVDKLVNVMADRYKDRTGGYVRIFKLSPRKGDNAKMAKLAFVGAKMFKEKSKLKAKSSQESKDKGEKDKKGILDRFKKGPKDKTVDPQGGSKSIDDVQQNVQKSRSGI